MAFKVLRETELGTSRCDKWLLLNLKNERVGKLEQREREFGNEQAMEGNEQEVLKGNKRITKAESDSNGNEWEQKRKTMRGKLGVGMKNGQINEQGG